MADMSHWQGKSPARHNLDGFAGMGAQLRRIGVAASFG
jgi:hypothetical protein